MQRLYNLDSKRSGHAQSFCPDVCQNKRAGQALLMTVILIGAAMLTASTIAGLLMVYQIRGSTDIANSQRAIAAADAGLECQMYDEFMQNDAFGNPDPNFSYLDCTSIGFTNTAQVSKVTCTDALDATTDCTQTSTVSNIYSRGNYNGAVRTLQVSF